MTPLLKYKFENLYMKNENWMVQLMYNRVIYQWTIVINVVSLGWIETLLFYILEIQVFLLIMKCYTLKLTCLKFLIFLLKMNFEP